MKRFFIHLIGEGLKGHKRTENSIEFWTHRNDFECEIRKLKKDKEILVKQYSKETDIFELEKKFRKIINGGTNVDWVLLDDGSYLAVKFTTNFGKVREEFLNLGFEKMAV